MRVLFIILIIISTSIIYAQEDSLAIEKAPRNPRIAIITSTILPGSGQIYNRKYWKPPIIYGLFVPIVLNVKEYHHDYRIYSNYLSLVKKDSLGHEYIDDPTHIIYGDETIDQLKSNYDRTRRARDLWVFGGMILWTLNVIDAYVDAELSNFDVSDDLSFRIYPSYNTAMGKNYYAVNLQIKF